MNVNLEEMILSDTDYELFDGDSINFYKISDFRSNVVTVDGSVNRPGKYEYQAGIKLSDLIVKADGFAPNTYFEKGRSLWY